MKLFGKVGCAGRVGILGKPGKVEKMGKVGKEGKMGNAGKMGMVDKLLIFSGVAQDGTNESGMIAADESDMKRVTKVVQRRNASFRD